MSKRSVRVVSLVVAVCALGCESSSSNGSAATDAAVVIPFDQLPAKYAAAACVAYEKCLGPIFSLFFNGANCTEVTTQRLNNGTFSLVEQKSNQGTVTYDGSKTQRCLDTVSNLTCTGLLERDQAECLAALDGVVPLGGDCDINEECKGSAICKSSSGTCPGQCAALLAAGQPCTADSDCESGLQCSSETGLCVKPAGVGQACEYGAATCGPGLICLGKDDAQQISGTCYNAVAALSVDGGASCDPTAGVLCKSGLSCVADSYDAASAKVLWKCAQTGSYLAGQACKPAFPDACATGYYCLTGTSGLATLNGTCTAVPDAKQPCGTGIGAQCKAGAVCVKGLCQSYAANGVSCTGDGMCFSQYCGASSGCEMRLPCK